MTRCYAVLRNQEIAPGCRNKLIGLTINSAGISQKATGHDKTLVDLFHDSRIALHDSGARSRLYVRSDSWLSGTDSIRPRGRCGTGGIGRRNTSRSRPYVECDDCSAGVHGGGCHSCDCVRRKGRSLPSRGPSLGSVVRRVFQRLTRTNDWHLGGCCNVARGRHTGDRARNLGRRITSCPE
jgi:hypothetical protein